MNIYNLIEKISISEKKDNIAFVFNGNDTTYEELILQTNYMANYLIKRHIKKDDKIAILLGNSPEFLYAYLAVLKLGAIVVPLNPGFTVNELNYIVNDSKAKLVIATSMNKEKVEAVQAKNASCQHLIFVDEINQDEVNENSNIQSMVFHEEDTAVILYTSGTTGNPKGAVLSHRNLIENTKDFTKMIQLSEMDRMIAVLPMFHSFCLTICVNMILLNGATTIIVPRFNPKELVNIIKKEQATLIAAVPTIYNYLNQLDDVTAEDFSSLRACISGGASIPIELLKTIQEKYKLLIVEGYGLSETSPVLTFNPYQGVCKAGSVGIDLPSVETKIFDEHGEEVEKGEVGEVVAKGPNVMSGYFNLPEETEKAFCNGWFKTGDIGKKDHEGYLYLLDRKKDIIITNGFNVYPREVEEVLYTHPNVVEAAIVGKPDKLNGEIVSAYLVVNSEKVQKDDLIHFCQKELIHYKIPREIHFVEQLPKNSTGKVLKRKLK